MTKVGIDITAQVKERLEKLQRTGETGAPVTPTQPSGEAPTVSKVSKPALYELDRYVKFRDPLMLVGIGCILFGTSQYSLPITYILAGVIILGISWMMAR